MTPLAMNSTPGLHQGLLLTILAGVAIIGGIVTSKFEDGFISPKILGFLARNPRGFRAINARVSQSRVPRVAEVPTDAFASTAETLPVPTNMTYVVY